MFNRKSKYYYGDGTDHILKLKPSYVESFLRFQEAIKGYTFEQLCNGVHVNISREDIDRHNKLADILNEYLENHTVRYDDTSKPILRRVT